MQHPHSGILSKLFLFWLIVTMSLTSAQEPEAVDLIVGGKYTITMDLDDTSIEEGAVAIRDGAIVAVGTQAELLESYVASETIIGTQSVLMPGLINGHQHAAMTMFRGVADDRELATWLTDYIFPLEKEFVNEELVTIGTELACLEMIQSGTTTFVDMYFLPDVAAKVVESCGMRALLSTAEATGQDEGTIQVDKLLTTDIPTIREVWGVASDRVTPILSAHAIYTIAEDQLIQRRGLADGLGVPVNIHVAESPLEVKNSLKDNRLRPVDYLDSIGFLDGKVIAAHMVYPSPSEIQLLATKGVGVVHNPTSNMKLASGVSPVDAMLAAGVAVGIGTDGQASNNDADLWEEMHIASLLQKVSQMDARALPSRDVLRMATSLGAKAIGLEDQIGSLEVGKRADLILVAINEAQHTPVYDVYSHLVNATDSHNVRTVIVDGNILMHDRQVRTMAEVAVITAAEELAERIKAAIAANENLKTTIEE